MRFIDLKHESGGRALLSFDVSDDEAEKIFVGGWIDLDMSYYQGRGQLVDMREPRVEDGRTVRRIVVAVDDDVLDENPIR